jgi:60S ribosome biogenesis protein Rrp14
MTSITEVRASLERHNDTFETLLRLIPPKFYLSRDESLDSPAGSKYQKHTKVSKEATKKAKRAKVGWSIIIA